MKAQRIYQWYIEAKNDFTNGVISNYLSQLSISEESVVTSVFVESEQRNVQLWKVPANFVSIMRNSNESLKFSVFVKEGQYGKIRKWNFPKKKKR